MRVPLCNVNPRSGADVFRRRTILERLSRTRDLDFQSVGQLVAGPFIHAEFAMITYKQAFQVASMMFDQARSLPLAGKNVSWLRYESNAPESDFVLILHEGTIIPDSMSGNS